MKSNSPWIFLTLIFLVSFPLAAQEARVLEEIYQTESLTWGQAGYLALSSQDKLGEFQDFQKAFEVLIKAVDLPPRTVSQTPITLSELSYVFLRVLGQEGNLLYTLIPSTRYAFRELQLKGLLLQRSDPDDLVSGLDSVRILTGLLGNQGGNS